MVHGRKVDSSAVLLITLQGNRVPRQVCTGGVIKGVVSKGQTNGHTLSSRNLAGDINDGGRVIRLFADSCPCDGVTVKGDTGIVLQVVPAAGTGAVESLAANGDARAHGNDQRIGGSLAVHGTRGNGGAFDVRSDVVLYIVIGNACTALAFTAQGSGHGSGNSYAAVLAQFVFGLILISRCLVRDFASIGIRTVRTEG